MNTSRRQAGAQMLRGGAFKPHTSPYQFQGLGMEGLHLLAEAREATGLPVVTEVMEPEMVETVAQVADVLQIGSRNMQNYPLLEAVGRHRAGRPVLLKRGLSAEVDMLMAQKVITAAADVGILGRTATVDAAFFRVFLQQHYNLKLLLVTAGADLGSVFPSMIGRKNMEGVLVPKHPGAGVYRGKYRRDRILVSVAEWKAAPCLPHRVGPGHRGVSQTHVGDTRPICLKHGSPAPITVCPKEHAVA